MPHDTTSPKKGFGSFFSYIDPKSELLADSKNQFNPLNNTLFYNGRHAIKYIVELIQKEKNINTFWLPEYYCQHVTHWLKQNYSNIKTYPVDPKNPDYCIEGNLFLENNDIILVNNFWGISKCNLDYQNDTVSVIEDHSHGWLSESCLNSSADFCVASLRKSVPAPLGGMAWIPNGASLKTIPLEPSPVFESVWNTVLLAMQKKAIFETQKGINDSLKTEFLSLINDAELKMHENYELGAFPEQHKETLKQYLKIDYGDFKQGNYQHLVSLLKGSEHFDLISSTETTFGLTLYFDNLDTMNAFKNHLISQQIYPSLLWPGNPKTYGYYLNIHIDYRYNKSDMTYMSRIINKFKQV
ncbi:hypothetical protein ACFFU1_07105 [Algibacter miyuki]|uniref:Aminotransferase class I/classII domain-containing protein n=1 Tax=Algibacter miyuki TaxID=1306933 RepID=A0ABV5GYD4_9FLAO|nr:hypothetical protein [Algibacter miyuki]MDN3667142.1 hypothetical protein [Algibacter miyuki]